MPAGPKTHTRGKPSAAELNFDAKSSGYGVRTQRSQRFTNLTGTRIPSISDGVCRYDGVRMWTAFRHLAASWLLIVAIAHVGSPVLSGFWGSPKHLSSGCDRAVLPTTPSSLGEHTADTKSDDDCDSCCFCCCTHLLPVTATALIPAGIRTDDPVALTYFSPSQRVRPGLLPPRA